MAIADSFEKGATEPEIDVLRSLVTTEIPKDFLDLYTLNNGQKPEAEFVNFNRILPIPEILESQRMLTDALSDFGEIEWLVPDKIKNLAWSSNWIKFTEFEGDGFILDLDPGPNGTYGQIFYRHHADNSIRVCAKGIDEFMRVIADLVEREDCEIDRGCVIISKLF
ncbi:SMI1/KNR4 family protein [Luteimonas sp. e5]